MAHFNFNFILIFDCFFIGVGGALHRQSHRDVHAHGVAHHTHVDAAHGKPLLLHAVQFEPTVPLLFGGCTAQV